LKKQLTKDKEMKSCHAGEKDSKTGVGWWTMLFVCLLALHPAVAGAMTYYVDFNKGLDTNSGTSPSQAWKTLTKASAPTYAAGDSILLARGSVWTGETLKLKGSGTSSAWITVDAYGTGAMPRIATGTLYTCMEMVNTDYWIVRNLELSDAGHGVTVFYDGSNHNGLTFSGLYIHDVNKIYHGFPSDPNPYASDWNSNGIAIKGWYPGKAPALMLQNVLIEWCLMENIGGAIRINGKGQIYPDPRIMKNIQIRNNYIYNCDDGSLGLANTENARVYDNFFDLMRNAVYFASNGTTGAFLTDNKNTTFANNICKDVLYTSSGDEDCVHVDEFNDTVMFYGNYITGAAGAGIQFMTNSRQLTGSRTTYNINHIVNGNTIVGNSQATPPPPLPSWWFYYGAMNYASSRSDWVFTGTANDNIWHDAYGFNLTGEASGYPGNWSNWTLTNNLQLTAAARVYHAAMGYSGKQGSNNWYYQYFNGSSYVKLTYDATLLAWGISGSYILDRFDVRPPASTKYWIARTWRAPSTGTAQIRGRVFMNTPGSGSGVKVRITKNGVKIWPAASAYQMISPTDDVGVDTHLNNQKVNARDLIRFELQGAGSGTHGIVSWSPSVGYSP
jgi:hypothetical protein